VVNLTLHAGFYFTFLKGFFASHPAGTEEYMKLLNRPSDQLVIWALLISAMAFGFLITTVMKWSGARNFITGLKNGFIMGVLFWTAINFGLYSSQHIFSLAGVLADLLFSASCMTISGAVAAWILGKEGITAKV
jgi:hypothetical protein